jgi:hypothetical protein
VVAHQVALRVARGRLEERLAGAVVLAEDADGHGADGVHLLRLLEQLRPQDAVLVGEHHDAVHLLLPDLPVSWLGGDLSELIYYRFGEMRARDPIPMVGVGAMRCVPEGVHPQARGGGVAGPGDVDEVEVGAREHGGDGVGAVSRLDDDPHELGGVDEAERVREGGERRHLERGGGGRGDGDDGPGRRSGGAAPGGALRVLDGGEDAVGLEELVGVRVGPRADADRVAADEDGPVVDVRRVGDLGGGGDSGGGGGDRGGGVAAEHGGRGDEGGEARGGVGERGLQEEEVHDEAGEAEAHGHGRRAEERVQH